MDNSNLWWGYKHTSGTYHAKRYMDRQDIDEALSSPFVVSITGPFWAENREDALTKVKLRT